MSSGESVSVILHHGQHTLWDLSFKKIMVIQIIILEFKYLTKRESVQSHYQFEQFKYVQLRGIKRECNMLGNSEPCNIQQLGEHFQEVDCRCR